MLEFLGPGDVVQPPAADRPRLGAEIELTVISDAVLSLLARRSHGALHAGRCCSPTCSAASEAERERLAIQGLINLPRAEHRLLLMLWHLGDSWGRVTVDGMMLPLSLHPRSARSVDRLATIDRVARDEGLEANGTVRRLDNGTWLITPAGARVVEAISGAKAVGRPLGETLARGRRLAEVLSESQALRAEAGQIRVCAGRGSAG